MSDKEKDQEKKVYVFGSKYPGYMIVLETGGPKFIPPNVYIPKVPFEGYSFVNGVFSTEDESLAKRLKAHKRYGQDFWEILTPADAKKVNQGRVLEVSGTAKSTVSMSTARK